MHATERHFPITTTSQIQLNIHVDEVSIVNALNPRLVHLAFATLEPVMIVSFVFLQIVCSLSH